MARRSNRQVLLQGSGGSIIRRKLGATKHRAGGFRLNIELTGQFVPPYLDARYFVRDIRDAILQAHIEAIDAGMKADGSGPQAPLNPKGESGRAAAKGLRPDARGVARRDGRSLTDLLTGTRVTGSGATKKIGSRNVQGPDGMVKETIWGTKSSAMVTVGSGGHSKYILEEENERGNQFFFSEGKIAELVKQTLEETLKVVIEGKPSDAEQGMGDEQGGSKS